MDVENDCDVNFIYQPSSLYMSTDPIIQFAVEAIQKQPDYDYASNLLWKAEEEWQESLYYWSSRFRAINWHRVNHPVPGDLEKDWQQYYGAEVVSPFSSLCHPTKVPSQ